MISCTWVGSITGNYGVKGQLKLVLEQHIKTLTKGTWLFLEIQKKPVPFFIEEALGQDSSYVVKLRGIDTPEVGRKYYNKRVGVVHNNISEPVENELLKLLGFKVINAASLKEIGVIDDIYDNSAHLLAKIVTNTKNEILIPIHENLVKGINEEEKELTLQIPEGLLNL